MYDYTQFYIDGAWVDPIEGTTLPVENPATEETIGQISLGSAADVDKAVEAARRAFETFSQTSRQERLELLDAIIGAFKARYDDIALAITEEMGTTLHFSKTAQAATGVGHFKVTKKLLEGFEFEENLRTTAVIKEPIGVVGMITPWNWPINQIVCKVAPALAAGCTMVLKPSEVAPISAMILAEVLHEAGVPAGVFNLVNGDGPTVGAAIAGHADVDMVSFTGSTRAGTAVAKAAADNIKRVSQELGGKSANIILDDADLKRAVKLGVKACMANSGQSCNAPTRMLVPAALHDEAVAIAREVAEGLTVGDPQGDGVRLGPLVSRAQYERVQGLIQRGIDEGATLVCGGTGKPEGLEVGHYARPTVFANVDNKMTIAQQEIFGPVLSILPYEGDDEAVAIANDSDYGLSGYVYGADLDRARSIARRMRTGMVHINGAPTDFFAPFGGYKQSGNGREWGAHGIEEFLEVKAVMGYTPRQSS